MTHTRLFVITLNTLILAFGYGSPALAQIDCPKNWQQQGMSECNGKCYAEGTMSRYDNPCLGPAPQRPASCHGKGMEQPQCAPWRPPQYGPPPPPPPPDAATANLMSRLLSGANVPSAQVEAVVKRFAGKHDGRFDAAGRAAASAIAPGISITNLTIIGR